MVNAGQLKRVSDKLELLKKKDQGFSTFGAKKHQFKLNAVLNERALKKFESKYGIVLPNDYREFLLHVGNGGAGPYYGLQTLQDGIFIDLDFKESDQLINPAKPFPFTEKWNFDFKDPVKENDPGEREKEYFDPKYANGLIRISNFGCGVSINLVVNGSEYGNVWVDDRCNDGGIYPDHYFGNKEKITFLNWYELWLDISLEKINHSIIEQKQP